MPRKRLTMRKSFKAAAREVFCGAPDGNTVTPLFAYAGAIVFFGVWWWLVGRTDHHAPTVAENDSSATARIDAEAA